MILLMLESRTNSFIESSDVLKESPEEGSLGVMSKAITSRPRRPSGAIKNIQLKYEMRDYKNMFTISNDIRYIINL